MKVVFQMRSQVFRTLFFFLVCAGCNPTSLEDYQHEGSSQCRLLLEELRRIEDREDLIRSELFLKKRFEKIVDLMIEARDFQQKHLDQEVLAQNSNEVLNGSLIEELERIYSLEGGREVVERAQREALLKLDAFERSLEKHQSKLKLK